MSEIKLVTSCMTISNPMGPKWGLFHSQGRHFLRYKGYNMNALELDLSRSFNDKSNDTFRL